MCKLDLQVPRVEPRPFQAMCQLDATCHSPTLRHHHGVVRPRGDLRHLEVAAHNLQSSKTKCEHDITFHGSRFESPKQAHQAIYILASCTAPP
jgi:hypothetical protein